MLRFQSVAKVGGCGAELRSPVCDAPVIQVDVVGASRDLDPLVRDDVSLIAGEALRNAIKHAQAGRVTVMIHNEARQLRLVVRDDGKGMDTEMIARHDLGHYGLRGVRERAATLKGRVDVRSAPGAGTEI